MKRKSSGFTIVELLIVIVIIGILAALVIAVYTGIQQRALNTSRIASAKALQNLLNAYVAQEGKYPYPNGACLGTEYTDLDGNGSLDCNIDYLGTANVAHPAAMLDTELKKIAPIPKVEISPVKGIPPYSFIGYLYLPGYTIDGTPGRLTITYYIQGLSQDCGLPIIRPVTGGYETSSAAFTDNYIGATRCRIAINEP